MALYDTTRPVAAVSTGGLLRTATRFFNATKDWNDARITRKALSQLSGRELDDIGLIPGDIDLIARRGH